MNQYIQIGNRKIGSGLPVYIIAEMSANHNQDFNKAVEMIKAAAETGADAVKIQTYTPDTLTINSKEKHFKIEGTIWEGRYLFDLYKEAYLPWEWQPKLQRIALDLGLDFFSTAYDPTSVDFLMDLDIPVFKIASFELVDLPLLRLIAQTGKPIILSTGMATLAEIEEAVETIHHAGGDQIALLKCTSAYPAPPEEMNLSTIPDLLVKFNVPVGISDHTLGIAVPVAAVALGACIVEKHFTISRDESGPDSSFSLEPQEFKDLVDAIRVTEKALGDISYQVTTREQESKIFRRSLFAVKDIKQGDEFTLENVRSIRPGYGLHTRNLNEVIGKRANRQISSGTPLDWNMVKKE